MSDFNVTSSLCCSIFFFFKQKTAYEMRISDWSSDVRSSDLNGRWRPWKILCCWGKSCARFRDGGAPTQARALDARRGAAHSRSMARAAHAFLLALRDLPHPRVLRSEEHTSELKSLMRISYAVFCLKKKKMRTKKEKEQ